MGSNNSAPNTTAQPVDLAHRLGLRCFVSCFLLQQMTLFIADRGSEGLLERHRPASNDSRDTQRLRHRTAKVLSVGQVKKLRSSIGSTIHTHML